MSDVCILNYFRCSNYSHGNCSVQLGNFYPVQTGSQVRVDELNQGHPQRTGWEAMVWEQVSVSPEQSSGMRFFPPHFVFQMKELFYLLFPPRPPHSNTQNMTVKGYSVSQWCAVRGIREAPLIVFLLIFFLTALKGLFKLPGESIHILSFHLHSILDNLYSWKHNTT